MKLTVGTTAIEITSCTRKRDLQKGFYLDLQIPKENISSDDLETLLDGCTEAIIVTEDDGSETEYKGFNELASVMTKNGVRHVAQYSTSEAMAQLSLAQKKIAELDDENAALKQTVSNQANTINAHAEVIAAQAENITAQAETIATLQAENKALTTEVLNTQLALCELYEQSLPAEETGTEESEVA